MNLLIKWLIYVILISCIFSQELNINTLTDIIIQHNSILKLSKKNIQCMPIGVYFDRKKKDTVHVISIITSDFQSVPINGSDVSLKVLKKMKVMFTVTR